MKIVNQSKGTILAQRAVLAHSLLQRTIGLLGQKSLKEGEALCISPCRGIHTFFMRFTIDAIFVDRQHKVIKAIPCLKPFRLSSVYWLSSFVIELPEGTIRASQTQEGDTLLLQ